MGFWSFISSLLNPTEVQRPSSRSDKTSKNCENREIYVYRPSTTKTNKATHKIQFKNDNEKISSVTDKDIKDLVDALTGAPLHFNSELFQCPRCKVFYQALSVDVIRAENNGRCVSCLNSGLTLVTRNDNKRGRNADVNVISLINYREFVGHVITFEGEVKKVLTSKRGNDFAVMFEDLSWTRGFKMVAFRGSLKNIGGSKFLQGLKGHSVRVRGLLVKHETYGYEIIISDRNMISNIQ